MLRWLRKRAETGRRAKEFYGSVVAAARQPAFYEILGVPDTPEGRFELIALHLFLAIENIAAETPFAGDLRQRTIEAFVDDMDDCMREMGVGDLGVPKRVKRAAAAFYERATIYRRDLTAGKAGDLAASLQHYVFPAPSAASEGASHALAHYVGMAAETLAAQPFDDWVESGAADRQLSESASTIGIEAT